MKYILKAARSAPPNATTTAGASDSFVSRHHVDLEELDALVYRSFILDGDTSTEEWLLWAANSSNLALVEDPSWAISTGEGAIVDGTQVQVQDTSRRSIKAVTSLVIERGDTHGSFTVTGYTTQQRGRVTLSPAALIPFGGALSTERGDTVTGVSFYLEAQRFWYTRNDRDLTRFGWDGALQRWRPFYGTPPVNLGILTEDSTMSPKTTEGIRIGTAPNDLSEQVQVVTATEEPVTWTSDAVLINGTLVWNPTYLALHQGETVWQCLKSYSADNIGDLGALSGSLFLNPVPTGLEYPFLCIGSRLPLEAVRAEDDETLAGLTLIEGQVGWSASSGKIRLNTTDIAKADPDSPDFELLYLNAHLYSRGVSLTMDPLTSRDPSPLVDDTGFPTVVGNTQLYLPPATFTSSGVLLVPDGTGVSPNDSTTPATRPNGCGLVRSLGTGAYIFGKAGAQTTLEDVEFVSEMPRFAFRVPSGTTSVALEAPSPAMLGVKDVQKYAGSYLYFHQPAVRLTSSTRKAELVSRWREPFQFEAGESFSYELDGDSFTWTAPTAEPMTAEEVVQTLTGATASQGYVWLRASVYVSITSSSSVLGFPALWTAVEGELNRIPDAGVSILVARSPVNLDRSAPTADFQELAVLEEELLSRSIPAATLFPLSAPPLLDFPGYSEGVFFKALSGGFSKLLQPYQDVKVDGSRALWLQEGSLFSAVAAPTSTLPLTAGVLSETMHPEVISGGGLYLDEPESPLVLQEDYLVQPGGAALITRVGARMLSGTGTISGQVLTSDALAGVQEGWRLKTVDGSFIVTEVDSGFLTFTPESPTEGFTSWELYEGFPDTTYDPGRLADMQYAVFNRTPVDPFQVWVRTPIGEIAGLLVEITDENPVALQVGTVTFPVTTLQHVALGTLNQNLSVPSDDCFLSGDFTITVGTRTYTPVGVSNFDDPLPGDEVQYGVPLSPVSGRLRFGDACVLLWEKSRVSYIQEFRTVGVEFQPTTKQLSFADHASYTGQPGWVRTQPAMRLGPIQGTVLLEEPLRNMQSVVTEYYQADVAGNKLNDTLHTEVLSIRVQQEVATYVQQRLFSFNPTERTLASNVTPQVWVDNRLQNFGNQRDVEVRGSQLYFQRNISMNARVTISYAVEEAFGGEQGFKVQQPPVWSPPFFLEAGVSSFDLEGIRTDISDGMVLRIGAAVHYITSVTLVGDQTRVVFSPPTVKEEGSRSPGNNVLSLVTNTPVSSGFMLSLSASLATPVDKGALQVIFEGDVTSYAVAGHLLELEGIPFLIAGSSLSERTTTVRLTTPVQERLDNPAVRISVRPIYPPLPTVFQGLAPVLTSQPVELIRFSSTKPGVTLVNGQDYTLDPASGKVTLTEPLLTDEWLSLSYTKSRVVQPYYQNGNLIVPRYKAGFSCSVVSPYVGSTLQASYSFYAPDSFYVRAVPLPVYQQEVAQIAVDRVESRTPHSGPPLYVAPSTDNWKYGTLPVEAGEREIQDQDRAARGYISHYDSLVQALEQVLETISGDMIGDWDGKFRFFVGQDSWYPGPGYEDPITGLLIPRFVWGQLFEAANGSFGVTPEDPLVNPATASQNPTTQVVTGTVMDPWLLDYYIQEQDAYVQNDMDDLVLTGKDRARLTTSPFSFRVQGLFKQMWSPSVISRLYPEKTLAFTTTYPGLLAGTLPEEPGVYAFMRPVPPPPLAVVPIALGSTFGMDIGTISNPALGLIQNITGSVRVRARQARARVWGYSATGYPELDPATAGVPTLILTPLRLKDFPIDPSSGLPDLAQLAANGGTLMDLSTGDGSLSTPAWAAGSPVSLGSSDGISFALGCTSGTILSAFSGALPFSKPIYRGVSVGSVLSGCLVTLTDGDNPITDAESIVRLTEGDPLPFAPEQGDTLYVSTATATDASGFANPPSVADLKDFAAAQPFLDVNTRERSSTFVDTSLPSAADPGFPIKEIVNQRTAAPLQPVEADVEFANTRQDPLLFPALKGEALNDSGDVGIPYLNPVHTELDALGLVQNTTSTLQQWYPNELQGAAGVIADTLETDLDLTDTRAGDLLLIQPAVGTPIGVTGILSVAHVEGTAVLPPRFVTDTVLGDKIRYVFDNMIYGTVTVTQTTTTTFEASVSFTGLNGLVDNPYAVYPNNNKITLTLLDTGTGAIVETVVLIGANVSGDLGTVVLGSAPTFVGTTLTIPSVGFTSATGDYLFCLSVDTYRLGPTPDTGSATAWIEDRLFFNEEVDLSSVQPRGTVSTAGVPLQGELSVYRVTCSGQDTCTVNGPLVVNDGDPFTFLQTGIGGRIRVPGFEGDGNAPIAATGVTFGLVQTTDQSPEGVIFTGLGTVSDGENWIVVSAVADGAAERVMPGDVLVLSQAVNSGTWIIRHAVPDQGSGYTEVTPSVSLGTEGWLPVTFPTVVSLVGYTLTLTDAEGFESTGRVFVLDGAASVSMAYTGAVGSTFLLTPGTALDATGNAAPDGDFFSAATTGATVGGHTRIRIGTWPQLPSDNVVGVTGVFGFTEIALGSTPFTGGTLVAGTAPLAGQIGVEEGVVTASNSYIPDRDTVVYTSVPEYVILSGLQDVTDPTNAALWAAINGYPGIGCLMPGNRASCVFQAHAGIFIEPSSPRPVTDLGGSDPHVVDAGTSIPSSWVGFRSPSTFGLASVEDVEFEVRRGRRFHTLQEKVPAGMSRLRFAYEIRRGTVVSITGYLVDTGTGTQLGSLSEAGVRTGDTLYVSDVAVEIAAINGNVIRTRQPVTGVSVPADFHIYLKGAPVPHEQSCEQLLVGTATEVLSRDDGRVADVNYLVSLASLETVQQGDLLVVDPAGLLEGPGGPAVPPEYGAPPKGDRGVDGRVGYVAGGPGDLDDNRGFYRVLSVDGLQMEVTGVCSFAGTAAEPVVFGVSSPEDQRFVVLPTVSGLAEAEGQQDLRVTHAANPSTNSYLDGSHRSVEPFAYRVFRPSGIVSEETMDLILFMRERVLSWMERIQNAEGVRAGSYHTFQAEEQIQDLTLGVLLDSYLEGLVGILDVYPFLNTAECMSVLDRRVWCLDTRLDALGYTSFETATGDLTLGSGRPIGPDLVEEVLSRTDRLRELRYAWIQFRSNQVNGTLPGIARFREQLPRLLEEQKRLLLLKQVV